MNNNLVNRYEGSYDDIIHELKLHFKYTFGDKLFYIGTTTEKTKNLSQIRDIDIMIIIKNLNEGLLSYVLNIISIIYTKYNILIDARIYNQEQIYDKEIISIHRQYLLKIFLRDLYGENPYTEKSFNKNELIETCKKEIEKQKSKMISLIPRCVGEHSFLKEITQCVFDALRAFLIIQDEPNASKEKTCKFINDNYSEFSEVNSIYNGYLNPDSIIKISDFIIDSLALVKHIYYRVENLCIEQKVLLINTPSSLISHPRSDYINYDHNMPLGLICIASYLKKNNVKVDILDAYAENLSAITTVDKIFSLNEVPMIIGFNTSSPNIHIVHKIASYIKRINKRIIIVCGGAHATLKKDHTLSTGDIDYVIAGEGEIPFLTLIRKIFGKDSGELNNIPGIFRLVTSKIIGVRNDNVFELNNLPLPEFNLLPIEKYFTVKKRLYFHATRGCSFNCIYCSVPLCWNKKVKEIPLEVLFSHIDQSLKQFEPKEIQIVDDNFSHKKGKIIKTFCNIKKQKKLKFAWKCQVRADQLDTSLISLMAENECFEIDFGIESGNVEIQRYIRKSLDLDKTMNIIKEANKKNIYTKAFLMIGFPEESYAQISDTINYAINLKECGLDDVAFFPVMPFPGTEISDRSKVEAFQGAKIDNLDFYGMTYSQKKLRKYSSKPEFSLNSRFSPEELRILVKFAYQRFDLRVKVKALEKEFEIFYNEEEEHNYIL